jgi:hypothetical protein
MVVQAAEQAMPVLVLAHLLVVAVVVGVLLVVRLLEVVTVRVAKQLT